MKHSIPSQDYINSSEWKRSFWDEWVSTKRVVLPMKGTHKNSSHSLPKSKNKNIKDRKRRTRTTNTSDKEESRTKWNNTSSCTSEQTARHGDVKKRSPRATTSPWTNSKPYWESIDSKASINSLERRTKRRRIKVHAIMDQIRRKDLKAYERVMKNERLRNSREFTLHPRAVRYNYLGKKMWLQQKDTHVKRFTIKQCKRAIKIAKEYLLNQNKHEW